MKRSAFKERAVAQQLLHIPEGGERCRGGGGGRDHYGDSLGFGLGVSSSSPECVFTHQARRIGGERRPGW